MKLTLPLLALGLVLAVPALAKAQPTLAGDCASSTLVAGSTISLGKIIVDPVNLWGGSQTCTLQFASACRHGRVCLGQNETNGGGFPTYMGCRESDATHEVCGSQFGEVGGDVISYNCGCF
jgi:hypothetical protein